MNPIRNPSRSKVGFADLYLERYGSGPVEGLPEPDPDLFLIVCIPAYKEPDLAASLRSLLECDPPGMAWEIIVNINYPENSGTDIIRMSQNSLSELQQLNDGLTRSDVRIHSLFSPDMPARHAGVGLARKKTMDLAVSRFNSVGRPDGVLISFDADSSCAKNYLQSIVRFYWRNPQVRTANIYFEHPLSGPFDQRIYHSIAQYELYLRYMRLALEEAGHPHSIHTVGSSFTVRAKTYVRVNGMGRDKAGEDFYFLHKCIHLKSFWEINETAVWPSVRESDRVSFGTGASIQRQMHNEEILEVYHPDSFAPLKEFFSRVGSYRGMIASNENPEDDWKGISAGLFHFLRNQDALKRIQAMYQDSAGEDTFRAKFFAWFNGFLVLRYLNDVHKGYYDKVPVTAAARRLAERLGIETPDSAEEMLASWRNYERGRGNRRVI